MKRNKFFTAFCIAAIFCGFQTFAEGRSEVAGETELWYKAADIVEANASVLPAEKTIIWEELSPAGKTVSTEEIVIFYGETDGSVFINDIGEHGEYLYGQQLQIDYVGDTDIFTKRNSVNDGLYWTPFDDDVDKIDVSVMNTGAIEYINGTECLVFKYTLYRDPAKSGYDFKETIYDDYEDSESDVDTQIEGRAWIDGNGILRQIEYIIKGTTVKSSRTVGYCETVQYDYDGAVLYPFKSVLEGTIESVHGDIIVHTNFKATEIMSGFWVATDFSR